jgi:hypothetical protein
VIAAPDGSLLAAAGPGPELLFAELPEAAEPGEGAETGETGVTAVAYLADRRSETYRSWGV